MSETVPLMKEKIPFVLKPSVIFFAVNGNAVPAISLVLVFIKERQAHVFKMDQKDFYQVGAAYGNNDVETIT